MLGFIGVTGFLSMWLSNTATTAMMIPIAHAVVVEMWKQKKNENPIGMSVCMYLYLVIVLGNTELVKGRCLVP